MGRCSSVPSLRDARGRFLYQGGRNKARRAAAQKAYYAKFDVHARHRLRYRTSKMCEMDARVLRALIECGGGDRVRIWAHMEREASLSSIDRALYRFKRYGLVTHPIRDLWLITERGAIACALWEAKKARLTRLK
jgi:hypothetical protein